MYMYPNLQMEHRYVRTYIHLPQLQMEHICMYIHVHTHAPQN